MASLNIPRKNSSIPTPEEAFSDMMGFHKDTEEIPLIRLVPYENQPFRPYSEEKITELADSITANGLLNPIIVRRMGMGNYQILSGHNRVAAYKKLGYTTIKAVVKTVSDTDAALIMLESNLCQRHDLLPSELAQAYSMQLENLKAKAKLVPDGKKSVDRLSETTGVGRTTIQRYIRLTELIPELMDMVDKKAIAINSGTALSSLSKDEQYLLCDCMEAHELDTISLTQAEELKKSSQGKEIESEEIEKILFPKSSKSATKENKKEKSDITIKIKFTPERYESYFSGLSKNETASLIDSIIQDWIIANGQAKKETTNETN